MCPYCHLTAPCFPGIPNAKAMGQVLCANAEACYSPVKEALLACYEDPVFAAAVAANAEDYFDAAQSAGSACKPP